MTILSYESAAISFLLEGRISLFKNIIQLTYSSVVDSEDVSLFTLRNTVVVNIIFQVSVDYCFCHGF